MRPPTKPQNKAISCQNVMLDLNFIRYMLLLWLRDYGATIMVDQTFLRILNMNNLAQDVGQEYNPYYNLHQNLWGNYHFDSQVVKLNLQLLSHHRLNMLAWVSLDLLVATSLCLISGSFLSLTDLPELISLQL